MTEITTTEIREHFADIFNRVAYRKERIQITRQGKGLAVLIPIEDLKLIEALEDKTDIHLADKALKEKGTISWKKIKVKNKLK